jgi:3-hydroxy-9,10-secoandrosta-1,3,5(10)-triene-9,17-dione monooxygenase
MADDAQTIGLADRRIPAGGDWLSAEALAAITPAELTARTTALKPMLAEAAQAAEALRRPVDSVWQALRDSGVFYHFVPKAYGGLEFSLDDFIDAMLPLGEACASTGWVTSFCVEHNWMLAQFGKAAQDEIFGGGWPYVIAPGVTMPPGRAEPVPGGYRLTGRWRWGTGVMHADWILATGMIPGEKPPRMLFFVFPASEARVLDTWRMDGMAATGSNDIEARDLFVPEHRVIDMGLMREGRAPGAQLHANPIYRMPMLPFLGITAAIPAVGLARASVAQFRERLDIRVVHGTSGTQGEKPAAQIRLARADMAARTAEILLRDAARGAMDLARLGRPSTVDERISLRLQIASVMAHCKDAIATVCEGAGSSAHALDNPLQRALRDVNVMATHIVYDMDTALELRGRSMVGLPPNTALT